MSCGRWLLGFSLWLLLCFGSVTVHAQQPAAPPAAVDQATKDEARSHFEQGVAHFDREEWSAALAEFLRSRELFPTRVATKNAATCLRKEKRFDEALEMYETLLREFADMPPADKAFADKEIQDLKGSVGTLEVRSAESGATIVVDGRNRGTSPLPSPLRISAGTHVVRVYKDGFSPFETRVDIAGRSSSVVDAKLTTLIRGGRLRVSEGNGKVLDVVVDNVVVGKTPWEGALTPGEHVVILRGSGAEASFGTQPASAPVQINQLTPITLVAEPLDGEARIVPTPAGASVAIDGVTVGRGLWDGRLRVGQHKIEVASEGFLLSSRMIALEKSKRAIVEVELQRDPSSPLWAAKNPPKIFFELDGALGLAPLFGGDVLSGCKSPCSSNLPIGFRAVAHGGYELGSGIGFGLDVGYLLVSTSATSRAATLTPIGLAPNAGNVDDKLRLGGLTLGASAAYHTRGSSWPILVRLGAGVLLGSVSDARTGSFTNSKGTVYSVNVTETPSATYLAVTPEARIGRRIGEHFEVSLGVEVVFLAALSQPKWADKTKPSSANPANAADRGDGITTFGAQSIAGATLLLIAPGLGARYDF